MFPRQCPPQSRLTRATAIAMVTVLGLVAILDGGPWVFHHAWRGAVEKPHGFMDGAVTGRLNEEMREASWVFNNLGSTFNWVGYHVFGRSGSLVVPGRDGWMFYHSTLNLPEEDVYRRLLKSYGTMFQLLDKLLDKEKQANLYVLEIPDKALIYPEKLNDNGFLAQRNQDLDDFNAGLVRKGIHVVDLREVFHKHRQAGGDLLFYPDDTHWNGLAADLAASEMARIWADDIDRPREKFKYDDIPVYKIGDMPRMLRFPKAVVDRFHTQLISSPRLILSPSQRARPEFTLYGTSYSEGHHLSDRLGLATGLVPLDKSQAALRIDDLVLKMVHGLYFEDRLRPMRPVVLEFPTRYLHRTDTVPETLAQLRLHAYTFRWQPLTKIPLQECNLTNLKHVRDDWWQPENTDPIIELFAEQWHTNAEQKAKFLRFKIRVDGAFPSQNQVRVYYDIGEGYNQEQTRLFKLVGYPDWQVIIIPLTFQGKNPDRIRIDPIGRDWRIGIRDVEVL